MNKTILILITVLLNSCTSVQKQKLYAGIAGAAVAGIVGAQLGKELSPNKQSDRLNQAIGTGVGILSGAFIGAKIGESLWEANPENRQLPSMLLPDENPNLPETPKAQVKILTPSNPKKIKIETEMPSFLKGKVKEANVLTYDIEAYEEETDDGRKIYHEPHKAYEYTFE